MDTGSLDCSSYALNGCAIVYTFATFSFCCETGRALVQLAEDWTLLCSAGAACENFFLVFRKAMHHRVLLKRD